MLPIEDLEQKEKSKREKLERKRRVADERSHDKDVSSIYGELFSLADLPITDSLDESFNSSSNLPNKLEREVSCFDFSNGYIIVFAK